MSNNVDVIETNIPLVMLNQTAIEAILVQWADAQGFDLGDGLVLTWMFGANGYVAGVQMCPPGDD